MRVARNGKTGVALCGLIAALVALPTAPAGAKGWSSRHRLDVNKHRAEVSYRALQRTFYIRRTGLYRGQPYANAWQYGQALAATVSVGTPPGMRARYRRDLRARLQGLEKYADRRSPPPSGYLSKVGPPHGPGGARYSDDNLWFGIELLRAHHVHREPTLSKAQSVFDMVNSTWDPRPNLPCPGGIPWAPGISRDRNTVSNAPGAELGAQIYLLTGQRAYLQEAKRMYDWVRGCMLDPSGLYWDHINGRGKIGRTIWTYNQGTMIGAGVMLYRATRDRTYLDQAKVTAKAALRAFGQSELDRQPSFFNAIYIRNLLLLGSETGDRGYKLFAQQFAAHEWHSRRDRRSGLFNGYRGGEQLLDQAAMVQVFSMLAAHPRTYF